MSKETQEKAVPVGFRLQPSVKARLDILAAERGVFIYELLTEAVNAFLGSADRTPVVPPAYKDRLAKTARILAGKYPKIREGLVSDIDLFDRLYDLEEERHKPL